MIYLQPNEKLFLPHLQDMVGTKTAAFTVKQMFDGGMGTCYKILDDENRPYALKIIHSDLLSDEGATQRYVDEIKKWVSFSSFDGILEAICVVRINDIPCVVSKWMENGDLRRVILSKDPNTFYKCMERVVVSLKWVYDNFKVIHRDLKPGNILIDKHGDSYLGDWGIAKVIEKEFNHHNVLADAVPNNKSSISQTQGFIGTVVYASPEQIMGRSDIDFRSDIYSLGCIMYEWETGRPPFLGKTLQEIVNSQLNTKPQKLGGWFKKTNLRAEGVIMHCLEKDPQNRYQSYDELLVALRELARKHCDNYQIYEAKEKYAPVNVGYNDFVSKFKKHSFKAIYSPKGNYALVEDTDIQPYLLEADTLISIGDYEKATTILERLFSFDIAKECSDYGLIQYLVVNLSFCYNEKRETNKALSVLSAIDAASAKPAGYYVNLSNTYIIRGEFSLAEKVCREGLKIFCEDGDLIGNLTVALTQQGKLEEACKYASARLEVQRDVHSVCEAANILYRYGEQLKNTDFPTAIDHYKQSLELYREAEMLNPQYQVALYNIALLLFKLKRYRESNELLAKISNNIGPSEVLIFYVARNLLWTSNFEAALKFCDKWLKTWPKSIMIQRVRAEILVDGYVIGNVTKDGAHIVEPSSLSFFTEIIKDEKHRIATDYIFLAKIHYWMNSDDDIAYSFELLEQGKDLYPSNWKFDFYLSAYAGGFKGMEKTSIEEARQCIKKASWRETGYQLMSSALERAGGEENKKLASQYKLRYEALKDKKRMLYDSCINI